MSMPIPQVLLALGTHFGLKNHEPKSTWVVVGILILAPVVGHALFPVPSSSIFWDYTTFLGTLVSSVILYRASPFHPLSKHPGPLLCRITKFRVAWEAAHGSTHKYFQQLHAKYGPVVRVGPNELSIAQKDVIPSVLGNQGMHRGPIWDGRRFGLIPGQDFDNLIDVRDKHIHATQRKAWNQAFSGAAVKDYQEILARTGEEFASQLHKVASSPSPDGGAPAIDLGRWVSYFAFDFMGYMAFGGSFNLMKEGDTQGLWKMMEDGLAGPAITGHIPWIMSLLKTLPAVTAEMDKFKAFGTLHSKKRIQMSTNKKDLFYHLYEASSSDVPIEDKMDLIVSDSLLTIVAGSDTTSTVLSATLCCLLSNPSMLRELRHELDDAFTVVDETTGYPKIEIENLLKLPYLSAVVNEGLRLAPAVPTNIQRAPEAGSGGRMLSEINLFIPEGTAINIPCYTIHRLPAYFSPSPESFIPERWLGSSAVDASSVVAQDNKASSKDIAKSNFVTIRDAFIPFSYGPANCAGKPLALIELRFVLAILVQRFDIWFKGYARNATREELKEAEKEWMDSLKDFFVFSKEPLEVHIALRQRSGM